jgi:hypothetical protein
MSSYQIDEIVYLFSLALPYLAIFYYCLYVFWTNFVLMLVSLL